MKPIVRLLFVSFLISVSASVHADEGKIPITDAAFITAPGSYILVNDVVTTLHGIEISVSNVKLDLNGFTVSSAGTRYGDGIDVTNDAKNVEITNGAVVGFLRHGIFIPGASATSRNIRLSKLRISDNGFNGVAFEFNSGFIVEDCLISGNQIGIYAMKPGLLINNVISENSNLGILASPFRADKLGYRSNVLFGNGKDIADGANLGNNLCSGESCP